MSVKHNNWNYHGCFFAAQFGRVEKTCENLRKLECKAQQLELSWPFFAAQFGGGGTRTGSTDGKTSLGAGIYLGKKQLVFLVQTLGVAMDSLHCGAANVKYSRF